ncbi:MAG: hypothetical protein FWC73_01820 [Defluviitaleaceae bacterium]|nr:hypothetical protein [Defluviitaleaceae bacterium]
MAKHIFRHIFRAPVKSFLSMTVALLFTLAMGTLQITIANLRADIDRLYGETIITAEVQLYQDLGRSVRPAGDIISIMHMWAIEELGMISQIYVEGSYTVFITSEHLDWEQPGAMDILVAVRELAHLTEESDGFLGRDDPFNMHVEFATGHNENSFAFVDDVPIPIIISKELVERRNLALGEYTYIVYYQPRLFRPGEWYYTPAVVIGIHDGMGLPRGIREGAVMPMDALETLLGEFTGFYTMRFAIDSAFNRELDMVVEEIEIPFWTFRYPRLERLRVIVWDQELRFGVTPLERHAELLRLLAIMTAAVSAVIGAGFAMMLLLQAAKNAAIMRVMGMQKTRAQIMLWLGQIILCMVGGLAGLLAAVIFGLESGIVVVAIPYLTGAMVGAAVGALLITNRAPLELLQVKD